MDLEFHYYINAIVAKMSGFDCHNSQIIANSSQFVDDNTSSLNILSNSTNKFYTNIITQTFDVTLPLQQLRKIYSCFHFQPSAKNAAQFWVTKPASSLSLKIFMSALAHGNPYLIGIASHAFCDTYAHQNFIGDSDSFNSPTGLDVPPSFGHMYFGELPDTVATKWHDTRTNKIIDNNKRFIKAALKLFTIYSYHNRLKSSIVRRKKIMLYNLLNGTFNQPEYYTLGSELANVKRTNKYRAFSRRNGNFLTGYDAATSWLDLAAYYCHINAEWIARPNFKNSHWYQFQEQAKKYRDLALKIIAQYQACQ